MASRPFTLLRRSSGGKPIFYFRLARPSGSRTTARSTGCTARAAAERWVLDYLEKNGAAPVTGARIRFDSWARDFWSAEGRYVRQRCAHGHGLSAGHVAHQHSIVQKYLLPAFARKYLDEITADAVELYLLDLYENGRPGARARGFRYRRGTQGQRSTVIGVIHRTCLGFCGGSRNTGNVNMLQRRIRR